jgi:hypothetical protein
VHYSMNELLMRNLFAIFDERDSVARMMALKAIWLPTSIFVDPSGRYVGFDAIDRRVAEIQAKYPDFGFIERGIVQEMHGVGRLAWGYGPADNRTAVTGIDVAVTRDGKILELYAFLD